MKVAKQRLAQLINMRRGGMRWDAFESRECGGQKGIFYSNIDVMICCMACFARSRWRVGSPWYECSSKSGGRGARRAWLVSGIDMCFDRRRFGFLVITWLLYSCRWTPVGHRRKPFDTARWAHRSGGLAGRSVLSGIGPIFLAGAGNFAICIP